MGDPTTAAAADGTPAAPAPVSLSARTATLTAGLQLLARVLSGLMVVASTAVVTRAVGVATYADWATALTVVAMLGFVIEPGLSPVVVRRLVQRPGSSPTLRSLLGLRAALALAAVAASVAVVAALRGGDAAWLALILAAQLLPRAAVLNAGAPLQADHRLHRAALLEVGTTALGLAAVVACAALDASAPVLALAGVTLPLVVLTLLVERELRLSPSAALMAGRDGRGRLGSVVREVAPLALALLLVSVYTRVQVVFVNAAEDALGVAEYLLAWQVVEQIVVVGAIAGATLLPFFADRARERPLHGDPLTQSVMVALGAVGTLLAAGLILTARPVMLVLGSDRLADGARFLVLLAPMGAALFIAMTLGYAYAAMGLSARYLRFNLAGLAVALALNATFTLSHGAEAAARATWVTEFFVVSLALAPVWRSGPAGRATILRLAALGALAVAAAEAVHADLVAPVAGAALLAAAVAALGGPALRELVATRLLARPGAAG